MGKKNRKPQLNCVVDKFKSKVSLDIYDKGFGLWITCEK